MSDVHQVSDTQKSQSIDKKERKKTAPSENLFVLIFKALGGRVKTTAKMMENINAQSKKALDENASIINELSANSSLQEAIGSLDKLEKANPDKISTLLQLVTAESGAKQRQLQVLNAKLSMNGQKQQLLSDNEGQSVQSYKLVTDTVKAENNTYQAVGNSITSR